MITGGIIAGVTTSIKARYSLTSAIGVRLIAASRDENFARANTSISSVSNASVESTANVFVRAVSRIRDGGPSQRKPDTTTLVSSTTRFMSDGLVHSVYHPFLAGRLRSQRQSRPGSSWVP